MAKKKPTFDFENALGELEQIVERMEQGDISLEDSLREFENGIRLTRACQKALGEAEQKVQILLTQNESAPTAQLEPFDNEP